MLNDLNSQALVPSLDKLLEYTHELSTTLTTTLGNLIKTAGEDGAMAQERILIAVAEATRSLDCARCMMRDLGQLRRVLLGRTGLPNDRPVNNGS
jgi:hypothetical protein